MSELPFRDRQEAARRLGAALAKYRGQHPLVLAIPRGAVPMARIVADMLGGDLDVVLVRKLGAPANPELAIGAVDEQGAIMLNENAEWAGADQAYVQRESRRQLALIRERRRQYATGRAMPDAEGRTVIVLDDGLATGATMAAALRSVRARRPARLVCAVPVAARESLDEVSRYADETVCLATPSPFHAVGLYYRDFSPVDDDEVVALLGAKALGGTAEPVQQPVRIPAGSAALPGDLVVPPSPQGLVLFAHGSGSGRHSVRNRYVAQVLQARGIATLLFDLLTSAEDADPQARFDIAVLTQRLRAAVQWAGREPALKGLPLGLFGASTGAAAALSVAAAEPGTVAAVVSRGGRPDMAGAQALARVRTPTLLIVGGADLQVLELNRVAKARMGAWADIAVIPGATHLFEEPGALEDAARLAADWLARHFGGAVSRRSSAL